MDQEQRYIFVFFYYMKKGSKEHFVEENETETIGIHCHLKRNNMYVFKMKKN